MVEAVANQGGQASGQERWLGHGRRSVIYTHFFHDLPLVQLLPSALATEHLQHHDGEGVHVHCRAERGCFVDTLGCHVADGACHLSLPNRAHAQAREAEISELCAKLCVKKDILELEITVHNEGLGSVQVAQS